MTTDASVTHEFAEFARQTNWADVPEGVRDAVRECLGIAVSLAIGASHAPAVEIVLRTVLELDSPPDAAVYGRSDRLGIIAAPLVNSTAVCVGSDPDGRWPTGIHLAAPIVPAALAVGEHRGASTQDVLTAAAVGLEVSLRIAKGICPEHLDRGWHLSGTVGHIGAAVAAARLLELDHDRFVAAMGLGATQAAGIDAAVGTMTRAFHAGKAGSDGVEAALLAERGFTGPKSPICGRRGFAALASPRVDPGAMLDGLGDAWELVDSSFPRERAHVTADERRTQAASLVRPVLGSASDRLVDVAFHLDAHDLGSLIRTAGSEPTS